MDALVRAALFRLDAERAHQVAVDLLAVADSQPVLRGLLRAVYGPSAQRPVEAFGLRFPNALGLAAGWDKDGRAWRALAALGFGHVEVGTVTPQPQPGNPRPRIFRLTEDRSLINRMGFPSQGASSVRTRLDHRRPFGVVLGVNLGKNKDTPMSEAGNDYVEGVRWFGDMADYLVVNVSSPNTPDLRTLQTGAALRRLLAQVVEARDSGRRVPLLVKLAPDLSDEDLADAVAAVGEAGFDGIIATNTTLSRDGLTSPLAAEAGGLSGAALSERALRVLEVLVRRSEGRIPVVAAGGVMGADDARRRLEAGAVLVQAYTGMVYGGAGWARRVVRELASG